jgi:hypothetical protein
MAKQRYKPKESLLLAWEERAEAVSGDFHSQEVANTLWAYATMGRKPGERVMGLLEGRAEAISGEFNSQDAANTLWAYTTMGRKPGERVMGLLEGRAKGEHPTTPRHLRQYPHTSQSATPGCMSLSQSRAVSQSMSQGIAEKFSGFSGLSEVGLHVISGQSGMTALMKAAAGGHTEVIRLLAALGADVNARGRGGMTALMYAAINGHASTTKALAICCSADPFACDDSGQTALEHAVLGGNTECVAILQMYALDRALLLGN